MPRVSVIIPTYNRSVLLKEAIESVLQQRLKDFELIVIDDGSTDDTRSIVKAVNDPRVKYFYQNNEGVSGARNAGLDKAIGEYIAFLDSDDLWPDSYLDIMISAMDSAIDYGVVYVTINQNYPDGSVVDKWGIEYRVSGWITQPLLHNSFVLCQAAVMRRAVLSDIHFDRNLNDDEDFDF